MMSSESALTVLVLIQILICYLMHTYPKFYDINPLLGILLSVAFLLIHFWQVGLITLLYLVHFALYL